MRTLRRDLAHARLGPRGMVPHLPRIHGRHTGRPGMAMDRRA